MQNLNLPSYWSGMTTYAKMSWLVNSHRARDWSDAARILNRLKAPAKAIAKPAPAVASFWYQRDD